MTETFNLGVRNLKELANTMKKKASTDLKQINSTFSSKTMAVEKVRSWRGEDIFVLLYDMMTKTIYLLPLQFLEAAVLEAKEVICEIQSSLIDQKQMLAFSAQQYEEVCLFDFSILYFLYPDCIFAK